MGQINYSIRYFYDSLPDWKKKIDSKPVRFFYRPASFWIASICAKNGIQANTVSYFSALIGIIGCVLYLPTNYWCNIIGALFINFWLVLDCTDGNLARCVKKQPYGEFADAFSSYILVGLMCISIGFAAFCEGGYLLESGNKWLIFLGGIASISDALTRSIYHKYNSVTRELVDKGVIPQQKDERKNHYQRSFIRALFEDQFGLGGFLPLFILLATVFRALDVITIYFVFYFGAELLATVYITLKKAISAQHQYNIP